MNKGINTFVGKPHLRPYIIDAESLSTRPIKWVQMPIVDCGVVEDTLMEALIETLLKDIGDGRVLYVHCWGGHGRAGTVVSLLLGRLYHLSADKVSSSICTVFACVGVIEVRIYFAYSAYFGILLNHATTPGSGTRPALPRLPR